MTMGYEAIAQTDKLHTELLALPQWKRYKQ